MSAWSAFVPVLLWFTVSAFAQGFWEKKPLSEWSPRECEKLLTDSPWAKNRVLGDVLIEQIGNPSSVDGREGNPWLSYTVKFWSAGPVRQAYVRQLRLAKDFQALPQDQKLKIEAQNERMLSAEYPDRIVLVVSFSTNVESYKRDLIRYWQSRPSAMWATDTFLLTGKGRIPPLGVAVAPGAGDQLELTFPRTADGQPVVGPNDKSISLEFVHPNIGVLRSERILFNFKIKDMTVAGKPVF